MRAPLVPLRIYYLVSFAALGAYVPFFPRWLEARGVHGAAMGAVCATFPAMGLVGPPIFGLVADTLGLRGAVLRVACGGAFLAFAAIAVASLLSPTLPFAPLFLAVLVYSLFRSPMVMMADVVALEEVARGETTYGRLRMFGSLGFLGATLAAGRWLDIDAPAALPTAIAAALLAALVSAWALPARAATPPAPALAEARALLADPSMRFFLAASLLGQIGHACYDLCYSLYLRDLGAPSILVAAGWAGGVAAEIALMACSASLLRRFSAPSLLAFAFLGATVRWALIAEVRSIPWLLALAPLHALSFGLMWVASLAYLRGAAPARATATAQGLFTAAAAIGSVVGMLAWGRLYALAGGRVTFGSAAIVAACACGLTSLWALRALRTSRALRASQASRTAVRNSFAKVGPAL